MRELEGAIALYRGELLLLQTQHDDIRPRRCVRMCHWKGNLTPKLTQLAVISLAILQNYSNGSMSPQGEMVDAPIIVGEPAGPSKLPG